MDNKAIVAHTAKHVHNVMAKEGSGHDWWHVYRVWKTALKIAKYEKDANLAVVQLGALLHDIADWKFNNGDEKAGEKTTRKLLMKLDADSKIVNQVCYIVRNTSFRGAGVKDNMISKEGQIVQDADRLDAIGAIGIARAFMYGGYKGRLMYDPNHKPEKHRSFSDYKASDSPSINHFYEKLLLLKNRMHTKTGKEMADGRDAFMRSYLRKFFKEWEGQE
jgi:uncharacterized protein